MKRLQTQRLKIEPLEESHAEVLFKDLRHPSLYEFISERPPANVAVLRERFRLLAENVSPDGREFWLNWALYSVPGNRYVGLVQATVLRDRTADIGFALFRNVWGQGYAREAVQALIEHLRDDWGTALVRATVDPDNLRSVALLERLSFRRGPVRKDTELIHGILTDEVEYSLRLGSDIFAPRPIRRGGPKVRRTGR